MVRKYTRKLRKGGNPPLTLCTIKQIIDNNTNNLLVDCPRDYNAIEDYNELSNNNNNLNNKINVFLKKNENSNYKNEYYDSIKNWYNGYLQNVSTQNLTTGVNDMGNNNTVVNDMGNNDTGVNDTGVNDTGVNDMGNNGTDVNDMGNNATNNICNVYDNISTLDTNNSNYITPDMISNNLRIRLSNPENKCKKIIIKGMENILQRFPNRPNDNGNLKKDIQNIMSKHPEGSLVYVTDKNTGGKSKKKQRKTKRKQRKTKKH